MVRLRANRFPAFPAEYAPYPRECMRRCASGIQPLVFGYSARGVRGTGDDYGRGRVLGNRSSAGESLFEVSLVVDVVDEVSGEVLEGG